MRHFVRFFFSLFFLTRTLLPGRHKRNRFRRDNTLWKDRSYCVTLRASAADNDTLFGCCSSHSTSSVDDITITPTSTWQIVKFNNLLFILIDYSLPAVVAARYFICRVTLFTSSLSPVRCRQWLKCNFPQLELLWSFKGAHTLFAFLQKKYFSSRTLWSLCANKTNDCEDTGDSRSDSSSGWDTKWNYKTIFEQFSLLIFCQFIIGTAQQQQRVESMLEWEKFHWLIILFWLLKKSCTFTRIYSTHQNHTENAE